ncbi:hypothetical protein [Microbacterium sp. CPCC 204701]|uniref:hypothetical protein n=1 Tax=Microbacterium sp. CPCC 204701 TaxID=2493084 RepID=UPI000FD9E1EB|nr:hypothetical protein [Microbacterium sp. CPCC 204701]
MGELAYMVRADWAQRGTAMVPNSVVIRDWVGAPPYFLTVTDTAKFSRHGRGGDVEAADLLAPDGVNRRVFKIADLAQILDQDKTLEQAIIVLHPFKTQDLEILREVILRGKLGRLFVMIWSRTEVIKTWLDAHGALDLHTGLNATPPDALMMEAARMMINEEYNGLESGRGKDAVVQLVRAFQRHGYALDLDTWLRAYFAAGGTFRHAESITKLITEMQKGVKLRVKDAYVDNVFELIRNRAAAPAH